MAYSRYGNYYTICFITIICHHIVLYYYYALAIVIIILLVLQLLVCYFILVCYCTCYSRLLGPDASVYANGLVKTGGFTSALCTTVVEGGLRKRHNVSCENGRRGIAAPRRLRTGRHVQMHKFSRLTKIA